MAQIHYCVATEADIALISQIYAENMAALHGVPRTRQSWKALLSDPNAEYYIVYMSEPVAWFRLDRSDDGLWLGMLQVKPAYQRKGIGRAILSAVEHIARGKGFRKIGIHTTQDNIAARALYGSSGYCVTEIGPCTTADGVQRVGYTFRKEL